MSNVHLPILNEIARERDREDAPDANAPEAIEGDLMQVGDLAREAGKTVRAIHLYEQLELLKPAARSKGRYRLYGPEALVRIRWIGKLQDLGFSLTDIKAIVKDVEAEGKKSSAPMAMLKVRGVYKAKLDDARAQIERLRGLEREILASLEYLDTCESSCEQDRLITSCPVHSPGRPGAPGCNHHDREREVPDLVAGFRT